MFPNIHPVSVPGRSVSAFPLAPSLFEAIYAFKLPVLTPSQEIPTLLKNIHRCLQPGGTLHLTLVDPLPVASSLGPLLRAWIEQHLLFNLETSFYCTNPSRLIPIWLRNASLEIEAGTTSISKFSAVSSSEEQLALKGTNNVQEELIDQELRNILGRMTWLETWKDYIITDSWWWEDPRILDECVNMQTVWELHEIKACKGP